jgi:RNA polymerase sigma-70 factor (ECF subfamily)
VVRNRKSAKGEEEREKFAREAMHHLDHLYRVAFHLAKEPDEAQDLVQETYARALGSYQQFLPGTHLRAWLTKILYNFFFDRYHQAKRWVSVEGKAGEREEESDYWERVAAENPGPESHFLLKELNVKITDALKELPVEFRMPIILVDMGDLSYGEAAEALSCPLGTVRSRLFRGRRLLHKYLKGYIGIKEGEQEEK